ncbi:MAG: translation initiation factor IF-3 [Chitinophagales bacterium]|nr:translation initiation factor IF-3 [Chitinophagales bacterium]
MQDNKKQNQYRTRVNYQIRVPEVRVVLEDGSTLGVVPTREALKKAQEMNLDLVEINPRSQPPICKIMDFGKFKYDEKKKKSAAKQNQSELKEIKLSFNTEDNDLNHKVNMAKKFLEDKDKVKFSIKFRGREIVHAQLGRDKFAKVLEELSSVMSNSTPITMDGKIMSMTVFPRTK